MEQFVYLRDPLDDDGGCVIEALEDTRSWAPGYLQPALCTESSDCPPRVVASREAARSVATLEHAEIESLSASIASASYIPLGVARQLCVEDDAHRRSTATCDPFLGNASLSLLLPGDAHTRPPLSLLIQPSGALGCRLAFRTAAVTFADDAAPAALESAPARCRSGDGGRVVLELDDPAGLEFPTAILQLACAPLAPADAAPPPSPPAHLEFLLAVRLSSCVCFLLLRAGTAAAAAGPGWSPAAAGGSGGAMAAAAAAAGAIAEEEEGEASAGALGEGGHAAPGASSVASCPPPQSPTQGALDLRVSLMDCLQFSAGARPLHVDVVSAAVVGEGRAAGASPPPHLAWAVAVTESGQLVSWSLGRRERSSAVCGGPGFDCRSSRLSLPVVPLTPQGAGPAAASGATAGVRGALSVGRGRATGAAPAPVDEPKEEEGEGGAAGDWDGSVGPANPPRPSPGDRAHWGQKRWARPELTGPLVTQTEAVAAWAHVRHGLTSTAGEYYVVTATGVWLVTAPGLSLPHGSGSPLPFASRVFDLSVHPMRQDAAERLSNQPRARVSAAVERIHGAVGLADCVLSCGGGGGGGCSQASGSDSPCDLSHLLLLCTTTRFLLLDLRDPGRRPLLELPHAFYSSPPRLMLLLPHPDGLFQSRGGLQRGGGGGTEDAQVLLRLQLLASSPTTAVTVSAALEITVDRVTGAVGAGAGGPGSPLPGAVVSAGNRNSSTGALSFRRYYHPLGAPRSRFGALLPFHPSPPAALRSGSVLRGLAVAWLPPPREGMRANGARVGMDADLIAPDQEPFCALLYPSWAPLLCASYDDGSTALMPLLATSTPLAATASRRDCTLPGAAAAASAAAPMVVRRSGPFVAVLPAPLTRSEASGRGKAPAPVPSPAASSAAAPPTAWRRWEALDSSRLVAAALAHIDRAVANKPLARAVLIEVFRAAGCGRALTLDGHKCVAACGRVLTAADGQGWDRLLLLSQAESVGVEAALACAVAAAVPPEGRGGVSAAVAGEGAGPPDCVSVMQAHHRASLFVRAATDARPNARPNGRKYGQIGISRLVFSHPTLRVAFSASGQGAAVLAEEEGEGGVLGGETDAAAALLGIATGSGAAEGEPAPPSSPRHDDALVRQAQSFHQFHHTPSPASVAAAHSELMFDARPPFAALRHAARTISAVAAVRRGAAAGRRGGGVAISGGGDEGGLGEGAGEQEDGDHGAGEGSSDGGSDDDEAATSAPPKRRRAVPIAAPSSHRHAASPAAVADADDELPPQTTEAAYDCTADPRLTLDHDAQLLDALLWSVGSDVSAALGAPGAPPAAAPPQGAAPGSDEELAAVCDRLLLRAEVLLGGDLFLPLHPGSGPPSRGSSTANEARRLHRSLAASGALLAACMAPRNRGSAAEAGARRGARITRRAGVRGDGDDADEVDSANGGTAVADPGPSSFSSSAAAAAGLASRAPAKKGGGAPGVARSQLPPAPRSLLTLQQFNDAGLVGTDAGEAPWTGEYCKQRWLSGAGLLAQPPPPASAEGACASGVPSSSGPHPSVAPLPPVSIGRHHTPPLLRGDGSRADPARRATEALLWSTLPLVTAASAAHAFLRGAGGGAAAHGEPDPPPMRRRSARPHLSLTHVNRDWAPWAPGAPAQQSLLILGGGGGGGGTLSEGEEGAAEARGAGESSRSGGHWRADSAPRSSSSRGRATAGALLLTEDVMESTGAGSGGSDVSSPLAFRAAVLRHMAASAAAAAAATMVGAGVPEQGDRAHGGAREGSPRRASAAPSSSPLTAGFDALAASSVSGDTLLLLPPAVVEDAVRLCEAPQTLHGLSLALLRRWPGAGVTHRSLATSLQGHPQLGVLRLGDAWGFPFGPQPLLLHTALGCGSGAQPRLASAGGGASDVDGDAPLGLSSEAVSPAASSPSTPGFDPLRFRYLLTLQGRAFGPAQRRLTNRAHQLKAAVALAGAASCNGLLAGIPAKQGGKAAAAAPSDSPWLGVKRKSVPLAVRLPRDHPSFGAPGLHPPPHLTRLFAPLEPQWSWSAWASPTGDLERRDPEHGGADAGAERRDPEHGGADAGASPTGDPEHGGADAGAERAEGAPSSLLSSSSPSASAAAAATLLPAQGAQPSAAERNNGKRTRARVGKPASCRDVPVRLLGVFPSEYAAARAVGEAYAWGARLPAVVGAAASPVAAAASVAVAAAAPDDAELEEAGIADAEGAAPRTLLPSAAPPEQPAVCRCHWTLRDGGAQVPCDLPGCLLPHSLVYSSEPGAGIPWRHGLLGQPLSSPLAAAAAGSSSGGAAAPSALTRWDEAYPTAPSTAAGASSLFPSASAKAPSAAVFVPGYQGSAAISDVEMVFREGGAEPLGAVAGGRDSGRATAGFRGQQQQLLLQDDAFGDSSSTANELLQLLSQSQPAPVASSQSQSQPAPSQSQSQFGGGSAAGRASRTARSFAPHGVPLYPTTATRVAAGGLAPSSLSRPGAGQVAERAAWNRGAAYKGFAVLKRGRTGLVDGPGMEGVEEGEGPGLGTKRYRQLRSLPVAQLTAAAAERILADWPGGAADGSSGHPRL